MHLRRERYIGIAPLPGGLTNACVVTADRAALGDPARLLRDTLRTDRRLAARFADARPISQPVCLGPLAVDATASGAPGTADGRRCRGVHRSDDRRRAALRASRRRAGRAGGPRRSREWASGRPHQPGAAAPARVREQVALQSRAAGAGRLATRDARRVTRARTWRPAGSSARSAMRATCAERTAEATEFTEFDTKARSARRRTKGRPRRATRGAYREAAGRIQARPELSACFDSPCRLSIRLAGRRPATRAAAVSRNRARLLRASSWASCLRVEPRDLRPLRRPVGRD